MKYSSTSSPKSAVAAVLIMQVFHASAQTPTTPVTAAQVAEAENALKLQQFKDQLEQQELKHKNEMAVLQAALAEKEVTARETSLATLQYQKDIATLEAAMATQGKTEREAIFGATVTPKDGSISTNSTAEAMVVAQARLGITAKAIAAQVTAHTNGKDVFLFSGFPPRDLQAARSTKTLVSTELSTIVSGRTGVTDGLTKLTIKLNGIRKAPPGTATPVVRPMVFGSSLLGGIDVVQSGLSLLALTRVNRVFSGVALTPDNNAFLATMVAGLKGSCKSTQIGVESVSAESSPLIAQFLGLDTAMAQANFEIAEAAKVIKAQDALQAEAKKADDANQAILENPKSTPEEKNDALKKIEDAKPGNEAREAYLKKINAAKEDLDKVVKRGSDYLVALDKGKILGVETGKLLDVEDFERTLRNGLILYVNVNNVAGTNLTKQNILTNSFLAGAGVSASYVLVGPGFKTIQADTLYDYKGFYRVKDQKSGDIPSHDAFDGMEPKEKKESARNQTSRVRTGPASKR